MRDAGMPPLSTDPLHNVHMRDDATDIPRSRAQFRTRSSSIHIHIHIHLHLHIDMIRQ